MARTRRLVTFAALPACLFCACSSSSPDTAPTATQGGNAGVAGAASLGGGQSDAGTSSTSAGTAGTANQAGASSGGSSEGGTAGSAGSAGASGGSAGLASGGTGGAAPSTLGLDPLMGWSSWSFIRNNPTEASIQAQARGMHDSHLSEHGYIYVNIDDFYYQNPSTTVDAYGRWVVDAGKFPSGMAAMGKYIHDLGLKFGMYLTPGIPSGAVTKNTPIEGTTYHAADIVLGGAGNAKSENNYNFGANSMLYIDFSKPGAQEFLNSWAKLLASYGVDYVKLDGVGSFDIPDVQGWSTALAQSGRTIHFELSNGLAKADGDMWGKLSNGWRIDGDIECYCGKNSSFPLTNWNNMQARFSDAVGWQQYSHKNARNDFDSLELGNGDNDGLTPDERRTQMSFWALSAAPLLLGTDLSNLDNGDLALLTNDEVIAVDQAGVPAAQVVGGDLQVWVSKQPDGSLAVGLFNHSAASAKVTAKWSDLKLTGAATVRDLWAHSELGSFTDSFTTVLSAHAMALVRIKN